MIWAFLLGAYSAGFAIVLVVATAEWLADYGAPKAVEAIFILAAAVLWPFTVTLAVASANDPT